MSLKSLYQDSFTIEETIASGGFATIYRARYADGDIPVAIKIGRVHEDPGYAKSLREEARILSQMSHRSVVKLIKLSRPGKPPIDCARALEIPGRPYFYVMEFLAGGDLRDFLKRVNRLTVPEAAAIALEIARGLRHVHRRRYAHNDLKPENIVFREPVERDRPFSPVLVDFGIATRVRLQLEAGTLYIMAPEQLARANLNRPPELFSEVDPFKIDVWALGVLLYRMLGGKLPFEGRTERNLTDRILTSRPTSLANLTGVPRELDSFILDGCLAKDPNERLDILTVGRYLSSHGDGATATTVPGGWFGGR